MHNWQCISRAAYALGEVMSGTKRNRPPVDERFEDAACPDVITIDDLRFTGPLDFVSEQKWRELWSERIVQKFYNLTAEECVRMMQKAPLRRPDRCSECNSTGKVQGHHVNYHYPYQVVWLCTACHANKPRRPRGYRWSQVDIDRWKRERECRRLCAS